MHFLEWFIALRYLLSRERRVLIGANTLISIAGVAVGVAVLVVVMGIMDGATRLLFSRITGLFPHVTIVRLDEQGTPARIEASVAEALRRDPRVVFAEPMFQRSVMMQPRAGVSTQKEMIQVFAAERLGRGTVYEYDGVLRRPAFAMEPGQVLIGQPLAERLNLTTGTQILLYPFQQASTATALRLRPYQVEVAGLFQTGYYEFDANMAFVAPAQFRKMFDEPEGYDYVHVKLKDPWLAEDFAATANLPAGCMVRTWIRDDAQFFEGLKFQKFMLFIILALIVVVAAFNIIGTLVLMVYDKTRQIGILKAAGMRRGAIARIFLLDGMLIGAAGTALGVVLGLLVSEGLRLYKFPMPAAVYNFSTLPVENDPLAILLVAACAMAICVLASLLPAVQASRLKPVEALRYE